MRRLIDADHLLFLLNSAIELRKKLYRNTSDLDMMVDAVNDEPTAYDPDKVVEQLENLKTINVDIGFGTTVSTLRKDVVMEIVKAGATDGN